MHIFFGFHIDNYQCMEMKNGRTGKHGNQETCVAGARNKKIFSEAPQKNMDTFGYRCGDRGGNRDRRPCGRRKRNFSAGEFYHRPDPRDEVAERPSGYGIYSDIRSGIHGNALGRRGSVFCV